MSNQWITCPQCGSDFVHEAGTLAACPQCDYVLPEQPNVTWRLPPPTPSDAFLQMSGSDEPPTEDGQFNQIDRQTTHPLPAQRRGLRPLSSHSRPVQIAGIVGIVVIILCTCAGLVSGVNAIFGNSSATPTPGQVAQVGTTPTQASATGTATPGTPPTDQPTPTNPGTTPTPTPSPTATPTPTPTLTPTPDCHYPAVNNNPWCYTFTNTGKLIYAPASTFCNFFACISGFGKGTGYIVQCQDSDYSKDGGSQDVCSKHGGFDRNLYMP